MKKYQIINLIIFTMILTSCYVPPKTPNVKKYSIRFPKENKDSSKFVVFDKPPIRTKAVAPVYPDSAKSEGIQGEVWVQAEILLSGDVGAVEILQSLQSGKGGLDEAAIKCVKQWKYKPALNKDGKPEAVWVKFPIRFTLNN
ncbi:MAG: energy transducer TonB [Candidatus Cloacimonetes bacterium]|nr:energy transducer TonB [Candidatus Cloacimonadota bacterium]